MKVFLGAIMFHLKKLKNRLYTIGQNTKTPSRIKLGAVNPMNANVSFRARLDIFGLRNFPSRNTFCESPLTAQTPLGCCRQVKSKTSISHYRVNTIKNL